MKVEEKKKIIPGISEKSKLIKKDKFSMPMKEKTEVAKVDAQATEAAK